MKNKITITINGQRETGKTFIAGLIKDVLDEHDIDNLVMTKTTKEEVDKFLKITLNDKVKYLRKVLKKNIEVEIFEESN